MAMGGISEQTALATSHISITPTYPLDFHYIKALYLAHQYRECIHKCEEVIAREGGKIEAAGVVFLNFYAALSHESLARLMHVYSASRLPEISAAESGYLRALDTCLQGAHPFREQFSPSPKSCYAAPQNKVVCGVLTLAHTEKDKARLVRCNTDGNTCFNNTLNMGSKRVSRINFSWPRSFTPLSCDAVKTIQNQIIDDAAHQEISLPDDPFVDVDSSEKLTGGMSGVCPELAKPSFSEAVAYQSDDNGGKLLMSSSPPAPATEGYISPRDERVGDTLTRCSISMESMKVQLHTHLQQIRVLRQGTVAEQAERTQRQIRSLLPVRQEHQLTQSRSFWSFKDPQAESDERKARVEEGRARKWKRERFNPEKYVHLAQDALMELGIKRV